MGCGAGKHAVLDSAAVIQPVSKAPRAQQRPFNPSQVSAALSVIHTFFQTRAYVFCSETRACMSFRRTRMHASPEARACISVRPVMTLPWDIIWPAFAYTPFRHARTHARPHARTHARVTFMQFNREFVTEALMTGTRPVSMHMFKACLHMPAAPSRRELPNGAQHIPGTCLQQHFELHRARALRHVFKDVCRHVHAYRHAYRYASGMCHGTVGTLYPRCATHVRQRWLAMDIS